MVAIEINKKHEICFKNNENFTAKSQFGTKK